MAPRSWKVGQDSAPNTDLPISRTPYSRLRRQSPMHLRMPDASALVPTAGVSKSLVTALCVLGAATASSPFIVQLAYFWWDGWVIIIVLCMSLPMMGCLGWTLVQQRRRLVPSFATWPLLVAANLIVASVLAFCVLGDLGAAADLLLVPVAGAFLTLAWVQPRHGDSLPTAVLGVGLTSLIAWFAGRADEYIHEGVIAAGFIVATFASLAYLRRRGNLAQATMRP